MHLIRTFLDKQLHKRIREATTARGNDDPVCKIFAVQAVGDMKLDTQSVGTCRPQRQCLLSNIAMPAEDTDWQFAQQSVSGSSNKLFADPP